MSIMRHFDIKLVLSLLGWFVRLLDRRVDYVELEGRWCHVLTRLGEHLEVCVKHLALSEV